MFPSKLALPEILSRKHCSGFCASCGAEAADEDGGGAEVGAAGRAPYPWVLSPHATIEMLPGRELVCLREALRRGKGARMVPLALRGPAAAAAARCVAAEELLSGYEERLPGLARLAGGGGDEGDVWQRVALLTAAAAVCAAGCAAAAHVASVCEQQKKVGAMEAFMDDSDDSSCSGNYSVEEEEEEAEEDAEDEESGVQATAAVGSSSAGQPPPPPYAVRTRCEMRCLVPRELLETECFAHFLCLDATPSTPRRRPPARYWYHPYLCESVKGKEKFKCPRGDRCAFSHSRFEATFHPYAYKTKPCVTDHTQSPTSLDDLRTTDAGRWESAVRLREMMCPRYHEGLECERDGYEKWRARWAGCWVDQERRLRNTQDVIGAPELPEKRRWLRLFPQHQGAAAAAAAEAAEEAVPQGLPSQQSPAAAAERSAKTERLSKACAWLWQQGYAPTADLLAWAGGFTAADVRSLLISSTACGVGASVGGRLPSLVRPHVPAHPGAHVLVPAGKRWPPPNGPLRCPSAAGLNAAHLRATVGDTLVRSVVEWAAARAAAAGGGGGGGASVVVATLAAPAVSGAVARMDVCCALAQVLLGRPVERPRLRAAAAAVAAAAASAARERRGGGLFANVGLVERVATEVNKTAEEDGDLRAKMRVRAQLQIVVRHALEKGQWPAELNRRLKDGWDPALDRLSVVLFGSSHQGLAKQGSADADMSVGRLERGSDGMLSPGGLMVKTRHDEVALIAHLKDAFRLLGRWWGASPWGCERDGGGLTSVEKARVPIVTYKPHTAAAAEKAAAAGKAQPGALKEGYAACSDARKVVLWIDFEGGKGDGGARDVWGDGDDGSDADGASDEGEGEEEEEEEEREGGSSSGAAVTMELVRSVLGEVLEGGAGVVEAVEPDEDKVVVTLASEEDALRLLCGVEDVGRALAAAYLGQATDSKEVVRQGRKVEATLYGVDKQTWRLPRLFHEEFDVSIRFTGPRGTQYIRENIVENRPWHAFFHAVKHWGKEVLNAPDDLADASGNLWRGPKKPLTSYALLVMAIDFVARWCGSQQLEYRLPDPRRVRYRCQDGGEATAEALNFVGQRHPRTGEALHAFFRHYEAFRYEADAVVLPSEHADVQAERCHHSALAARKATAKDAMGVFVRKGQWAWSQEGKNDHFTLSDPMEHKTNLARHVTATYLAELVDKFRRTAELLETAGAPPPEQGLWGSAAEASLHDASAPLFFAGVGTTHDAAVQRREAREHEARVVEVADLMTAGGLGTEGVGLFEVREAVADGGEAGGSGGGAADGDGARLLEVVVRPGWVRRAQEWLAPPGGEGCADTPDPPGSDASSSLPSPSPSPSSSSPQDPDAAVANVLRFYPLLSAADVHEAAHQFRAAGSEAVYCELSRRNEAAAAAAAGARQ